MEDELNSLVDALPGLVWTALPDGQVDFVNRQWCEYTRLSLQDSRGDGWKVAIHPEDLPPFLERLRSAMSSGDPCEAEVRIRRYDREFRWFAVRANPMADVSSAIVRWCGLNWDIHDRKRKEHLLGESEQRFKAIFDEAGTGITLVDLTPGTPIRNNQALREMLGCSEEELSRFDTFDQLTFERDRENDGARFRELCEGRLETLKQEKHFLRRDGRSVWANVIFTLLRDGDGRPRYIIASHEDITERKLNLERLQANQELLDLAQKSAGAMAFDWYVQKEINYWSPEQESLFGLAPGTFDGTYKSWKKMMYVPDWPMVVAAIQHANQTGEVTAEYRVVWPDGSLHWLSTNGRMFFDETGAPYRMVGFTADVTRRKNVEEELRRTAAFLAQAQHVSSTGSFWWRPSNTDEITWSDELYRIFELDRAVPITLPKIRTRVHPDDLMAFDKTLDNARESGEDFETLHRLLMPDCSIKYVHVVAQSYRDWNGDLEYIGAAQDVTERRVSEEALDKARSELARVARVMSLGALTASIAHEVNQPLSGIITNASTCLRMLDANPPNVDGARETARRTIRDGNRAAEVITRLRALFSKKEATIESVDLNDAAREVMALLSSELQRTRVTIQDEFADDLPAVAGDRVQLQQVILNLLRNGSDAMSVVEDRPRQLTIRTEREEGGRVRLSVKDAGTGFDLDNMKNLFEAFYTTKSEGMGMGLSVSRSIIENHHGFLWAELNDGPGATFSFSTPCAATAGADAASREGNALTDQKYVTRHS